MITIDNTLEGGITPSRLELYWEGQGFKKLYKSFRSGTVDSVLMKKIADVRKVQNVFKLKGFQFGNWLTNEDRFNYLAALGICLYDLNKVLKFKSNNLGMNEVLGVSFGARGNGSALAHYEPLSNVINITRYKGGIYNKAPKEIRFSNTGGVGSFAHEYGHFLDFFFGSRVETDSSVYSLTNGKSTNRVRISYDKKKQPMRVLVEDIMEVAYYSPNSKEPSAYYKRIKAFSKRKYYVERAEIFARLFEQYIGHKLKRIKIGNSFLTQTKYHSNVYMTKGELQKVVPLFDRLLVLMRQAF